MSTNTKFTIIIPTRERADTLQYALATALAQDYDNFEVLVSDNASTDNTADLVSKINDPRLRYINTGKRVSMSHNFEFALDHVSEGWVAVIGDDDGLLPGALTSVNKIISETGTLVISSALCLYKWPSLCDGQYGELQMKVNRKGYTQANSQIALNAIMNGRDLYNGMNIRLPMLYTGCFVHTSLINQAKSVTGKFFQSMTPDAYSSVVLSLLTDFFVYSYQPLGIGGASHNSTGAAVFGKKKSRLSYDPSEKFFSEDNIPCHKDLPLVDGRMVKSISAVMYEAYLQAEPFHNLKGLLVTKDKQLEIILSRSRFAPDPNEVLEWAKLFAKLHNLNYDEVLRQAISQMKLMSIIYTMLLRKIKICFFDLIFYGNKNMPLANVFEAFIIVGQFKDIKPRIRYRFYSTFNCIRKRVFQFLGYAPKMREIETNKYVL